MFKIFNWMIQYSKYYIHIFNSHVKCSIWLFNIHIQYSYSIFTLIFLNIQYSIINSIFNIFKTIINISHIQYIQNNNQYITYSIVTYSIDESSNHTYHERGVDSIDTIEDQVVPKGRDRHSLHTKCRDHDHTRFHTDDCHRPSIDKRVGPTSVESPLEKPQWKSFDSTPGEWGFPTETSDSGLSQSVSVGLEVFPEPQCPGFLFQAYESRK